MKKICFPAINRVHKARQKLFIKELRKYFKVDIWQPKQIKETMANAAVFYATEFNNYLIKNKYDAILERGDRFEFLPSVMISVYRGLKVIHIEGGAESGIKVVDTKVRDAVSQLADIHLVTDEQAQKRMIFLGASPNKIFNVGSLDVSYANSIKPKRIINKDYILCLFHSIPGEDEKDIYEIVKKFKNKYKIIGIKSNSDYQESIRTEEYSSEDFISLLYFAKCVVGNSSCICKETSILGTPAVLIGERQGNRIIGRNVLKVPFDKYEIEKAIEYQLKHKRYKKDYIYYQRNSEKKICKILKKLI